MRLTKLEIRAFMAAFAALQSRALPIGLSLALAYAWRLLMPYAEEIERRRKEIEDEETWNSYLRETVELELPRVKARDFNIDIEPGILTGLIPILEL